MNQEKQREAYEELNTIIDILYITFAFLVLNSLEIFIPKIKDKVKTRNSFLTILMEYMRKLLSSLFLIIAENKP
mgnify:CR=1 FL=1